MGKYKSSRGANATSFKPGQSGNPGGKPKAIIEVTAAARAYTEEMLNILVTIARDTKATATARATAAENVLSRAWGKAPQTMTLKREGEYRDLNDDDLIAELIAVANGGDEGEGITGDLAPAQSDPEKLN